MHSRNENYKVQRISVTGENGGTLAGELFKNIGITERPRSLNPRSYSNGPIIGLFTTQRMR